MTNPPTPQRAKAGRPVAFTPAVKRRLIRAIAAGVPIGHACAACRVSVSGFYEHRASNPKFAERIAQATALAIEHHLGLIIAAANSGDAACSRWFLERCHSAHFGRVRMEVTGADGSPLAAAVAIYLPQKNGDNGGPVTVPAQPVKEIENGK